MKKYIFFILILLCLISQVRAASVQYVNSGGAKTIYGNLIAIGNDDNNSGETIGAPVATIIQANENIDSGGIVYICGDGDSYASFNGGLSYNGKSVTWKGYYEYAKPIIRQDANGNVVKGMTGTYPRNWIDLEFYLSWSEYSIYNFFISGASPTGPDVSATDLNFYNCKIYNIDTTSHQFLWTASAIVDFYNCVIDIKSKYGLQAVSANLYNSIFTHQQTPSIGSFNEGSVVFNCTNTILYNCAATGTYNLPANSKSNLYYNNTGFGTYGDNPINASPAFAYDYFIADTSPAKNSGVDSIIHRGLTQDTLEYNITHNNYIADSIALVTLYGTFNADTRSKILSNNAISYTKKAEVFNTKYYQNETGALTLSNNTYFATDTQYLTLINSAFPSDTCNYFLYTLTYTDSAFVISKLLTLDTPTLTSPKNTTLTSPSVSFVFPIKKGAQAVKYEISALKDMSVLTKSGSVDSITASGFSETLTVGTWYWRIAGYKK